MVDVAGGRHDPDSAKVGHTHLHLSRYCLVPADSLISRIMCYEYTTALPPAWLAQTTQTS